MLIVVLAVGFAWLTRNPEAEILEQARDWPVIGPLARAFRQAYLPPEPPVGETPAVAAADPEVVVVYMPTEEMLATSFVWVEPGTELHDEPDLQSPVLLTVASIRNVAVLENRGDWYRVSVPLSSFDRAQGWVWLENYQEPTAATLRQPDPVLPLPAASPDPEKVALARRLMGENVEVDCGLYPLITDATELELVEICERIAAEVERIYPQRYGLEPVSAPAETVLLFRRVETYREFRLSQGVGESTGLASGFYGLVALYQGDRSTAEVLATLVHELTHLLNRRALGPALPPWLGEGLASDLGESKIADDGSIHPGVLDGGETVSDSTITRRGGLGAAIYLQRLLAADELPLFEDLVEMDQHQFQDPYRAQLHYALSSFWVRYLVSDFDSGLQAGFRSFLSQVAAGRPITEDNLLAALSTDWQSLETGFRTWLRLQFVTPPNEARPASP